MNYIRDGHLADAANYGAAPNYWPNSIASAPKPDASFADPAWTLGQTIVDRFDSTVDHDDYTQAGNLYRLFDAAHRERLTRRIGGALSQARREVQMRQLCHFFRADIDYGTRVARALGSMPRNSRPRWSTRRRRAGTPRTPRVRRVDGSAVNRE